MSNTLPQTPLRATSARDPFLFATAVGAYRALLGDRATRSAAARMELDGRWLQFELEGSDGAKMSLTGNTATFDVSGGRTAKYERLENGIKESITISERPSSNLVNFAFEQSGLEAQARRDGYHFCGSAGDELFFVKNPVVYDAKGVPGGATLAISGTTATIRIEEKFLAEAAYPIVVDPTIVATASQASPAGLSVDRHIVRATNGTLVFFYQSGAGLRYKTSGDNGASWSAAANISPPTFNEFSVFISAANDIYITYRSNGATDSVFFRKLTYNAGSWAIGVERTVEGGGQERRYPSIVREAGGLIWVAWRHRQGGYTIRVRSSSNEGAAWSASTTLATVNNRSSASAVIYQNRAAVVYEMNDASLEWRRYNGAGWVAAQTIVSGGDYDDANWGSLTTTSDGNLHMVYAPQGGGWIRYITYNGAVWSSPYTVASAANDRYPSISTDGSQVFVVWSQYVGTNQYKLVYRKNSGGSWDTEAKSVSGPEESEFTKALIYTASGATYDESLSANEYVGSGTAQAWRADDQSWSYTLPFPFRFYDTTRTTVWVCSNGFLDFTSNNADWSNTTAEMRNRVMICGMWDDIRTDLAAQPGEDIYIYQPDSHSVVFRWVGQISNTTNLANVEIRLYDDGRIKFNYVSGNTALTPTVGVSAGDGIHYSLSTYDGASILTNVQTSAWSAGAATNWLDRTSQAANSTVGDIEFFSNNGDALYLGLPSKFDYAYFDLQTPASASIAPTWEYWDGGGWQPLAISDNPGFNFTASGRVGFSAPAAWQSRSLNGSGNLYYIRVARTAPALATAPVGTQMTSVRNNGQAATASIDTTAIPVGWSEGVASPYSVRFAAVPLVDITLSIQGTYDRNGTFHAAPPYGVDFGDMDPEVGQYTTRPNGGEYAVGVRVVSDGPWSMTTQATGDLTAGSGNTAPISSLKWAFDGSSSWTSFVKAPASAVVVTGQAPNFPNGTRLYFDYQFNVDWMTEGSSQPYGTTLTYTAIQGS